MHNQKELHQQELAAAAQTLHQVHQQKLHDATQAARTAHELQEQELVDVRLTAHKNVDAAQSLAQLALKQAQSNAYQAASSQDEAGILIKTAVMNNQIAHQALRFNTQNAQKAICDERRLSSTRLTTMQDRSRKHYTRLKGVKRAACHQERQTRKNNNEFSRHENAADDAGALQNALGTHTRDMVILKQKLEISELNCLNHQEKLKVCNCVNCFNKICPRSITNILLSILITNLPSHTIHPTIQHTLHPTIHLTQHHT